MSTQFVFEYQDVVGAWNRATKFKYVDRSIARIDRFDNVMRWSDFGLHNSQYGWIVVPCGGTTRVIVRDLEAVNIHANDNGGNDE